MPASMDLLSFQEKAQDNKPDIKKQSEVSQTDEKDMMDKSW